MKNKVNLKNSVWVHGFAQTQCPEKNPAFGCIHYDSLQNQAWPVHADTLCQKMQSLSQPTRIYAYSLGGLITLRALLDQPDLQKKVSELICVAVPLYGVSIAKSASSAGLSLLATLFWGLDTSKLDKLMASLRPFSPEIVRLHEARLSGGLTMPITWITALGKKGLGHWVAYTGDGLVEAPFSHPNTATLSFASTGEFTASFSQASHIFCSHADHRGIKDQLSHLPASGWCGDIGAFEVYFIAPENTNFSWRFSPYGTWVDASRGRMIMMGQRPHYVHALSGQMGMALQLRFCGRYYQIPAPMMAQLCAIPRIVWLRQAKG